MTVLYIAEPVYDLLLYITTELKAFFSYLCTFLGSGSKFLSSKNPLWNKPFLSLWRVLLQ